MSGRSTNGAKAGGDLSGRSAADVLRARTAGKIVVLQIDDRLGGRLANSERIRDGEERPFDDSVVGVSALCNFLFCHERDEFEYVFVQPPPTTGRRTFRDVDGQRPLSSVWGKPYSIAVALRAMPEARWFLAVDTDAFLGMTAGAEGIPALIDQAERLDRHLVLQAARQPGRKPGDLWAGTLGDITPPVYAEPQAFNAGVVLVRQSPRAGDFVTDWLGLSSARAGASPLEQRLSSFEVRAAVTADREDPLVGLDWGAIVAGAIREARRQGAPIREEHEAALVSKPPTRFRDIESCKGTPSAKFDAGSRSLAFSLRCVTTLDELLSFVEWVSAGGGTGRFATALSLSLRAMSRDSTVGITSIAVGFEHDATGRFLDEWPGEQERLSWAFTRRPADVYVVPWKGFGGGDLQNIRAVPGSVGDGHRAVENCTAAVWHPCARKKTKSAAAKWVHEALLRRHRAEDLSVRRLPVLEPNWDTTKAGPECNLEALHRRLDAGDFEFWDSEPSEPHHSGTDN